MMNGDETLTAILQANVAAQFDVVVSLPCATQTQYSVLESWLQETVALVSPGTNLTFAGGAAEPPLPPPQPASSIENASSAMPRICFIRVPMQGTRTAVYRRHAVSVRPETDVYTCRRHGRERKSRHGNLIGCAAKVRGRLHKHSAIPACLSTTLPVH